MPDKSSHKFMEELKRKKDQSNRLTGKVGQVTPAEMIQMKRAQSAMPKPQAAVTRDQVQELPLNQLAQSELNPKYT
jgi:hypothetical protein